jgi:hypothetical protein
MAKKLKKNTTIAKAKSLKTNVTRKFEVGGPGDPIKPRPAEVQPFPDFYNDNKKEFDAADAAGRQRLTNWFDQRAAATGVYPEHTKSATVLSDYLKNSGQSVYVPEPKVKKGEDAGEAFKNMFTGIEMADSQAFANEADYTQRPASVQSAADRALNANKYSFPDDPTAKINATGAPLAYNTAYYRGMHGAKASTHLEEQLHLASGFAQEMEPEHLKSFKDKEVQAAINPENMKAMGYFNKQTDKAGNVIGTTPLDEESINYFTGVEKGKQTDEFYPRLITGRTTLGLQGGEKYDATQMGNFLQQGYDNLKAGKYTEPGLQEHLIEFYRSIGYPLPSSEFTKGATPEQIEQQKAKAAEAFRIANDKYAMQKNKNTEDYGLPQAARYGGYKYKKGGPGKKKDPLKKATIATAADSSFVADGADIANNYYLNNGYTIKPNADFRGGVFDPFAMLAAKRKYYNNGTNIDINTGKTIPYSDYTTYKKGNPQFEQRELTIGVINKDAPKSRYDTRIKPQKLVTYRKVFDKTGSGYTGDTAEVPVYDRVATTPWKDLTDDEKIQRLQEFGASGTPYKATDIQQAIQDIEKNRKPMESIGMKPIESKSAPVTIESQFPQESYTLQETGNGGGAAYLHKTVRDKYGNIIQSGNMGVVLTKDFLTPEQQKEFDSIAGGTAAVQFNPQARIWHDLREPLDIIEEQRGTRQKTLEMQKRNVDEVNAEKAAYEQYEQQLRDKEKARQKKIQEEIEAEKAANKKAMGGFGDPEDPEKPWRHKIKSKDGNYLYNRVGTNAIQDYDKSTVRRTLKGFITGAPKPEKTIYRTSDAKFAEGGMNKNMLNANSTTGPRSEQSWQDPGVNRFSGNTNGVNADYYFKKGGLKSKVSSKFAKLKL